MKARHLLLSFIVLGIALPFASAQDSADTAAAAQSTTGLRYSLTSVFETHCLFNLTGLDGELDAYGFQPLGSPFLFAWGIKGSFHEPGGLTFGAKVTYGNQSASSADGSRATYLAATKFGVFAGRSIFDWMDAAMEGGFGAFSQSVSSQTGGGAMVYLGPYIQPRISLHLHRFRWLGEINAGYYLHFPLGPAHANPLWEETFSRPLIHGVFLSVGSGVANPAN